MRSWKITLLLSTMLFLASFSVPPLSAETHIAKVVSQTFLQTISDDESRPLPRQGPLMVDAGAYNKLVFPKVRYRNPAEYEPEAGILIRWGSFNDVLTQIVVGITTGNPEARVYIIVNGRSQRQRAEVVLAGAGAGMRRISFICYRTDSPWIRDYGPRFLTRYFDKQGASNIRRTSGDLGDFSRVDSDDFDDDPKTLSVLDHTYNRARHLDDQFPSFLSTLWGESRVVMPIVHAGGNFHVFSTGEAFTTDRIVRDNPGLKRWRLAAWFLEIANIDLTVFPSFPVEFDESGHIDMWMLPVADHRVIIGQYPSDYGLPHDITENAAKVFLSRGFAVDRIPGWQSRGVHYTFTNALIFNNLAFVPNYPKFPDRSRVAIDVFRQALPNHQLIPIDCSRTVHFSGAIHCLVLHVPRN